MLPFNKFMNLWAVVGDNLLPFVPYTAIGSIDADKSTRIPTEPIEGGRLAAYNNVQEPERVTVSLYFDGDYAVQVLALAMLDQKIASAETCTIFSPAKIWRHMALDHYDFSRAQGTGATFLSVQCSFVEIIAVNLANQKIAYKPKNPTSATKVNTGQHNTSSLFFDLSKKL